MTPMMLAASRNLHKKLSMIFHAYIGMICYLVIIISGLGILLLMLIQLFLILYYRATGRKHVHY